MLLTGLALAAALLVGPDRAAAAPPLATAIYDPKTFAGDQSDLAFARTKNAGATLVDIQKGPEVALWVPAHYAPDTCPNLCRDARSMQGRGRTSRL
jgi:hypothetical protein